MQASGRWAEGSDCSLIEGCLRRRCWAEPQAGECTEESDELRVAGCSEQQQQLGLRVFVQKVRR